MLRFAVVLTLLFLVPTASYALTDEEIFRDFRFNLINPGARSLGLGGAFVSVADDATAAQANPAGLSFLLSQEYFGEYRYVDNAARSTILRETLPANLSTFVATGTDLEDVGTPSFLSVVFPVGEKWRLAVSRQELLRAKNSTLNSFAFTSGSSGQTGAFLVSGEGFLDARITNYNFSFGYRVHERLGVGASFAYSQLKVRSSVTNIILDTTGAVAGQEILEPTLDLRTGIDEDDNDFALNLGLIYGAPTDQFKVGLVYRRAPKFSVTERIDTDGLDVFHVRDTLGTAFPNQFNAPDSYGVSIAWQPTDRFTFVQDFERTEYSDLAHGFVAGVNVLTDFDAEFKASDAVDYRAGMEYLFFPRSVPLAVRGGIFTESDSALRAVSTGTRSFATPASFPGRQGELHGAGGVGAAFKQGRYRLDLAADFATSANEYVLSFIYRSK